MAALLGFRRLAGHLGGDADALLRASGINPAALASPDNRISYAAMIGLLEACARQLNCPDFGLRLSGYQDIDILGPAAMIAHYSDTVGETLSAISTYMFVHTTGASVQVMRDDPDYASLTFEVTLPGLHARRQINELSMGIGQTLLEMLIGPGFRSERVLLAHRRPDDVRSLVRRFGRYLHFDQAVNALTLPGEALHMPVPTANPEFRSIAVEYVRKQLGNTEGNRVRRIELLVRQLLPTGRCSLQAVSDILGMHPRTLQRDLRTSGAAFRGIVDDARRRLVTDYLRDTDATLAQVAAMLGYGDQAAFNNAFRRWYGVPPGRWRERHSM